MVASACTHTTNGHGYIRQTRPDPRSHRSVRGVHTNSACQAVCVSDVWLLVHGERFALIDDLAHLTDDQWAHPSLWGDWTVHDVAAHLIGNAKTTRLGIVRAMVRSRFDVNRQNAQGVERERGATPHETLARLRQVVPVRRHRQRRSTADWSKRSSTAKTSGSLWASSAPIRRRRSSGRCGIRRVPRLPPWAVRSGALPRSGCGPPTQTWPWVTDPKPVVRRCPCSWRSRGAGQRLVTSRGRASLRWGDHSRGAPPASGPSWSRRRPR